MSGIPDTFDVNAIVPFANAAKGLPDGASVTDKVSTISAYISLEVCRTFARLHGKAGAFEAIKDGALEFVKLVVSGVFLVRLLANPSNLQGSVAAPTQGV